MKLSISNIAWPQEKDEEVYQLMKKYRFTGLEIAPTRWFAEDPYEHVSEAVDKCIYLKRKYGFRISSMQSIWFGRTESIWGSSEEQKRLNEYTQKAIDFAVGVECGNLVFGCPRNRNKPEGVDDAVVFPFFRQLGDYASKHHTVIAIEANPSIYHTNYINCTQEALKMICQVDSEGIRFNLDVGTVIENGEDIESVKDALPFIHHVHISEPHLAPVKKRVLHEKLAAILRESAYQGYVSIEMGNQSDIMLIEEIMEYVSEVFG